MFILDEGDLHGIKDWYEWYKEWCKNPVRKYSKAESEAKRKKCKVGKYREWTFSEARFNEISNGFRNKKIDKIRHTKMLPWVLENHPEHADLTSEEWIRLGYHHEVFGKYSARGIDQEDRFRDLED